MLAHGEEDSHNKEMQMHIVADVHARLMLPKFSVMLDLALVLRSVDVDPVSMTKMVHTADAVDIVRTSNRCCP